MDLVSYDFVMVPMDREFCIYLFWSAVLAKAQVTTCPRVAGPLQCPCCPGMVIITSFYWQTCPNLHDKSCGHPISAYMTIFYCVPCGGEA